METPDTPKALSKNEGLKAASDYLRGTILADLVAEGGSVTEESNQLLKFHGTYLQDDRDVRTERRRQKLDKAWSFMIRVRVPGGVCTPAQWLEMDRIADQYANGTLKLTTRQAFQFHGVLKESLKSTIAEVNGSLLDTISACGDVNRNVMCNPNPFESRAHEAAHAAAVAISTHLTPKSRAYHEIWLDEERVAGPDNEGFEEPIYGKTYLPRKFKIAVAVPPYNDVDILTNDLGFTAIVEAGEVVGYNVTAGGGMGMSHGQHATYPRLADQLGFILPEAVVKVAEAVVTTQRDFGDRTDRKHARLKYTIEDMGLEHFKAEVEQRSGITFAPAREATFTTMSDRYGWTEGWNGKWQLNLFIQGGRVKDTPELPMKAGLRRVAQIHRGDFRLTGNQNLIIANVDPADRPAIEALLQEHGLLDSHQVSGLRRNSLACVALPTCGLSLAESERKLPELMPTMEESLRKHGLEGEEIVIRMTGCPNGCARPYNAEIGLVGRAPGKYNLYLGGSFEGDRLNRCHAESQTEPEILATLDELFGRFATERQVGEHFGDFCVRTGIVRAVTNGRDVWS